MESRGRWGRRGVHPRGLPSIVRRRRARTTRPLNLQMMDMFGSYGRRDSLAKASAVGIRSRDWKMLSVHIGD
jgi:hypothetical protein